ncbi:hypothetical protein EJ05DRAFT_540286 [Pseudovirgaria hyperparasitica]|uniref:Uncharacterized protein n=1 Tax=Pseudovirgaria hyperparasitica TaxID=470096 RepID=A0A6A6W0C7_9PEZI|nr:uncharacterized protein EJ05DRAFT_540286 [Pseudovirgaria hyperparasitica]KAF2755589.1 hypothetical protein EJ05DRAFT_540286 [Pseudovirgaria hyperparasitica]
MRIRPLYIYRPELPHSHPSPRTITSDYSDPVIQIQLVRHSYQDPTIHQRHPQNPHSTSTSKNMCLFSVQRYACGHGRWTRIGERCTHAPLPAPPVVDDDSYEENMCPIKQVEEESSDFDVAFVEVASYAAGNPLLTYLPFSHRIPYSKDTFANIQLWLNGTTTHRPRMCMYIYCRYSCNHGRWILTGERCYKAPVPSQPVLDHLLCDDDLCPDREVVEEMELYFCGVCDGYEPAWDGPVNDDDVLKW